MKNLKIYFIFLFICLFTFREVFSVNEKERYNGDENVSYTSSNLFGYKWGEKFSEIKKRLKNIKYEDTNKRIVYVKNFIVFTLGFFPFTEVEKTDLQKSQVSSSNQQNETKEEAKQKEEGLLYYINLSFPLTEAYEIIKKYNQQYGVPKQKEENFILWETNDTVIYLWLEKYNNSLFSRRVDFISKELSNKIKEYIKSNEFYKKRAKEILNTL